MANENVVAASKIPRFNDGLSLMSPPLNGSCLYTDYETCDKENLLSDEYIESLFQFPALILAVGVVSLLILLILVCLDCCGSRAITCIPREPDNEGLGPNLG